MFPNKVNELIVMFSNISGVGEKTAQRYIFDILKWEKENIEKFGKCVSDLVNVKYCSQCGNFAEDHLCDICLDIDRNKKQICVVENIRDLLAIEKTNLYNGKYKVLNRLISVIDGVYPDDLDIDSFVQFCKDENIEEVIMALSLNVAGETTSLYISKKLDIEGIHVTRLASGIPMGSNVEYIDSLTLSQAFEGRKKI